MENDKAILKEIKTAVHSVDLNVEVILFGSRTRGDFKKESDWEILALTNRTDYRQLWDEV